MIRLIAILIIMCIGCTAVPSTTPSVNVVTAIPTTEDLATDQPTPEPIQLDTSDSCETTTEVSLPVYEPTTMSWVTIIDSNLIKDGLPYPIYGINYYPRLAPFDLFLMVSESEIIRKELEFVTASGINTARIYVNMAQLFECDLSAMANTDTFTKLDMIIQTIAASGLHLIVNLYDDIHDVEQQNWEQLQFFVQRYQNEPAIIAWDVLEKGDVLYETYTSDAILTWLGRAIQAIRQVDNRHLVTASWQSQASDTMEWVDMVSFQHFGDYSPLRQEIANLKSQTNKPILLSAIGFSTFDVDETAQRNLLFQAIEEVENNDMAGWMIYMAFDYPTSVTCTPPDCPASPTSQNYYGIWNTSYFPKLAVDAVKRVTETE